MGISEVKSIVASRKLPNQPSNIHRILDILCILIRVGALVPRQLGKYLGIQKRRFA